MIILKKGKTIIKKYESAYDFTEDNETLQTHFIGKIYDEKGLNNLLDFVRKNAFSFCIYGAKARLGGGYILETEKRG